LTPNLRAKAGIARLGTGANNRKTNTESAIQRMDNLTFIAGLLPGLKANR
jgi:hypothetical protein